MKTLTLIPLLLLLGCREPKQKEMIISDSDTDGIKWVNDSIAIQKAITVYDSMKTHSSKGYWLRPDTTDIYELDSLDNGDIERSAK